MGEQTPVRWPDRLSSRLGVAFMATALAAVAIVTTVALTASSTGIEELAAEQRAVLADDVVAALEVAYLEAGGWADAELLPAHTLAASAGAVLIVTTPDLGELPTPPELGPTRQRLQVPADPEPGTNGEVPPIRGGEEPPDRSTGENGREVGPDGDGSPGPFPPSTDDTGTDGTGGAGDTGSSGSGGANGPSGASGPSGSGGEGGARDGSGGGPTGDTSGSIGDTDGGRVPGDAATSGRPSQGPATGPESNRPSGSTRPAMSCADPGATRGAVTLVSASWQTSDDAPGDTTRGVATLEGRARSVTIEADRLVEEGPAPNEAELIERIDRSIVIDGDQLGTATLLFVARAQPDPADAFRASLLPRLLLGSAAAALLALGITAFVTLRLTRPLRQLTDDVEHLRDDPKRPSVASRPTAPGELGVLRTALDQMADDLRRQERLRRALIADVGHELRTPVTILLAELEAIRDGVLPADDDQFGSLHEEVQRIARLVEDVSSLADAEASGFSLERERFDLAAVTEAAARGLEVPLRVGEVTVTTALEPVTVDGDRRRLEQVVRNLVTNAARFAPPGSTIEVVVATDGDDAVIEVRDRGSGFLPDELPHVFERFWRGREAVTTGGSGIGLAVVSEVVAAHGGRVAAANRPEGGASLTVRLPRTRTRVPVGR